VLQPGRLINQGVVLQLDLVPDDHARPDVGTAADDAVRAEPGVRPDLSKVPDRGARPEYRALIHISGRMDRWAVHAAFPSRQPMVMVIAAEVVELPAVSVATAVSLCVPFATPLVFQLKEYGLL